MSIHGGFIIRKDRNWNINRGGTISKIGQHFDAIENGQNILLQIEDDSLVQVVYDDTLELITVNPIEKNWSVIGDFFNLNWNFDIYMRPRGNGIFESEIFHPDGEFKIRWNGTWNNDRGGKFVKYGEIFKAIKGGDNISVGENYDDMIKIIYDSNKEEFVIRTV